MKKGRSDKLIELRNQALIARYYYWSEIWERRYDKVLETLSKHEFFISETTIHREILRNDNLLKNILNRRPDVKELALSFPGFNWTENKTFTVSKKQMALELAI